MSHLRTGRRAAAGGASAERMHQGKAGVRPTVQHRCGRHGRQKVTSVPSAGQMTSSIVNTPGEVQCLTRAPAAERPWEVHPQSECTRDDRLFFSRSGFQGAPLGVKCPVRGTPDRSTSMQMPRPAEGRQRALYRSK